MKENEKIDTNSKVAIVTGGAKGIGAEIVRTLAENGYIVILNYNNSKVQAEELKNEMLQKGFNIEVVKADVSNRNEVNSLIEFAIKKFKKIEPPRIWDGSVHEICIYSKEMFPLGSSCFAAYRQRRSSDGKRYPADFHTPSAVMSRL